MPQSTDAQHAWQAREVGLDAAAPSRAAAPRPLGAIASPWSAADLEQRDAVGRERRPAAASSRRAITRQGRRAPPSSASARLERVLAARRPRDQLAVRTYGQVGAARRRTATIDVGRQQVGCDERDPVADAVAHGVLAGEVEGVLGHVHRDDRRPRRAHAPARAARPPARPRSRRCPYRRRRPGRRRPGRPRAGRQAAMQPRSSACRRAARSRAAG